MGINIHINKPRRDIIFDTSIKQAILCQEFINLKLKICQIYVGSFLSTNGHVYSCGNGNKGQLGVNMVLLLLKELNY